MFSCFSKCFTITLCLGCHKSTVASWSVHIQMLFLTIARVIWNADKIISFLYLKSLVFPLLLLGESPNSCVGYKDFAIFPTTHLATCILSHNWLFKDPVRGNYLSLGHNPFSLPNIQFTSLKVFLCPARL